MSEEFEPKIIGLDRRPHAVNLPPEVNAQLIETLEDLLERARSGEIVGVAYATQYRDQSVTHYWAGSFTGVYTVVGALHTLSIQLVHGFFSDDD